MRHDEILGFLRLLIARLDVHPLLALGRLELAFWLVVLLLAAIVRWQSRGRLLHIEGWLRRNASHQMACVWGVGAAVAGFRLLLLPLVPTPIPVMLDEFGYLLGADTFASGRLTNPQHPMWRYFESFNINVRPSYQSMYPPAQAMVMAVGQWLHSPWVGVVLSVALMCAALCWMLQGWLPPHWALLGAILAALRFGIFSYWINSYWGGAVAATGGALLLGALPRLRRKPTASCGVIFALGLVILANSRPFEGLLFALPLCGAVVAALRAPLGWPRRAAVIWPMLLVLTLAAAGMLYYNYRGTGHALEMPYTLNQATYHISRPFLFQKPNPVPHYNNPQMRTFYVLHEYPDALRSRELWGIEELMAEKLQVYYVFFAWPLALLLLPATVLAFADRELRMVALAVVVMFVGLLLQLWPAHGHYAAPATGAILLLMLHALRRLRQRGPWSLALSRACVLTFLLVLLLPTAERLWDPYALDDGKNVTVPREVDRQRILTQLERTAGEHLVIVHYAEHDVPSREWVYNRADIDHAKVVWARDMGEAGNGPLLAYFAHRRVWYVDHGSPSVLIPYSTALALTDPARVMLASH